ncbi:hypothetical protein LCGC14_1209690, partial [marine sediment metagenome]
GSWDAIENEPWDVVSKKETICQLTRAPEDSSDKVFTAHNQEAEANARLIAAAPDLAAFVGRVMVWEEGDGIAALQQEARSLYEAAIAKARP